MAVELKIKNRDHIKVKVDDHVYEAMLKDKKLTEVEFLKNLRMHSSGYCFFQKNYPKPDGKYITETIYLHRWVAENFIPSDPDPEKKYVLFKSNDTYNCCIENLLWAKRSQVVRNSATVENRLGYRGVTQLKGRYIATIYKDGVRNVLGSFNTPEEAALAYNEKSIEFFGPNKGLNVIRTPEEIEELKAKGILVNKKRVRRTKEQILRDNKREEKRRIALELKKQKLAELKAAKPKSNRGRPRKYPLPQQS